MPHVKKEMISFFLTTQCNLRCGYCYNEKEREKDPHTLRVDFAQKGVDYFFEKSSSRHIRFYGPGEPTQAFGIMKKIYDYAKEKAGDKLSSEIQTNGVFDGIVRDWLGTNINIIWISFDGMSDIQDNNRPTKDGKGSSSYIESNVNWLIHNSDAMVGARVTMTADNIHRQKEMVNYFLSLGITRVWTNPLFPSVETVAVTNDIARKTKYSFDIDAYIKNYIEAYRYAKEKGVFWGSFLTCNFDGESNRNCRACIPVPHLTPDGYISACDMVTSGTHAGHMEPFIIGKWNDENKKIECYPDRIKTLQHRTVENMPGCKCCKASNHCAGYCLGEVTNETGDLFGKKPWVCKAINELLNTLGVEDNPYEYLHP
jgi:radical SAM protein with 4Fe4S-binding SPASM domain